MPTRVTPADLAEWRRLLEEDADEVLDPTVAQQIAPRLMAEVEQLWREIGQLRAAGKPRAA